MRAVQAKARAGWLTPSAFEYQYVLGCGVRTVSTPRLDREVVDVLWVGTKAMRLDPAVALAPPDRVRAAIVITLRNGVDHVAPLPKRYPNVASGLIASS